MADEPRRPVCLFASYDPDGLIRPHVEYYLTALHRSGLRIVVGQTSRHAGGMADATPAGQTGDATRGESDADAVRQRLKRLGIAVVERPNGGLDFGTWKHLIGAGHVGEATRVVLANDSVYGPFGDLPALVRRMDADDADAWAMVESRQRGRHVQSWFISLTRELFFRPAVQRVFDQPFDAMSKLEIIVRGELALSAAFEAEGARVAMVWPTARQGRFRRLLAFNPMLLNWEEAVSGAGVPFIKTQVLRDNPMALPWVVHWRRLVQRFPDFPIAAIEAHLMSQAERAAPPAQRSAGQLFLWWMLTRDRYATRSVLRTAVSGLGQRLVRRPLAPRRVMARPAAASATEGPGEPEADQSARHRSRRRRAYP